MFYSVLRTGRTPKLLQSYQSSFISQFRKVKYLYIPFMTRPEETLTEERMFFRVYYQSASTKDNRMKKLSVEDQGRLPPPSPLTPQSRTDPDRRTSRVLLGPGPHLPPLSLQPPHTLLPPLCSHIALILKHSPGYSTVGTVGTTG